MPDLGKYADTVLSAYGITLLLLAGLVLWVRTRSRAAERRLRRAEGGQ